MTVCGGRVEEEKRVGEMDSLSRSLVQLSTLFIGNGRVLSSFRTSNLDSGPGELGRDVLIDTRLVCYSSAPLLTLGDIRSDVPESDCLEVPVFAWYELMLCSAWSMMLFDIVCNMGWL